MQNIKNKTLAILIATILTISIGASTALIPISNAHLPAWNIPTYAFCNVGTNPDGVGQAVNIGLWLGQPPPTANGPYGDRWHNLTVTVTKPDGTKETLCRFNSDDTGGTATSYTPTEVGTYTFQMNFPGQTLTGENLVVGQTSPFINDTYLASTSAIATLTVQQQPVGGVAIAPLPTEYWQTPITAMNVNNWYAISGASLDLGAQADTIQQQTTIHSQQRRHQHTLCGQNQKHSEEF